MTNKYVGAAKFITNLFKSRGKNPTPGTINTVPIAKDLTTKRNIQDQVVSSVNEGIKKADVPQSVKDSQKTKQYASEMKRKKSKELKDFSYKLDKIEDKIDKRNKASKKFFNKGGRVGKKFGGGADMGSKKLSPKQMKIASLAGNKKKIDKPDFKKLRAMKSPMDKTVRKA